MCSRSTAIKVLSEPNSRLGRVEVLACDWNGTLVDDVTRVWRATRVVLERRKLTAPDLPEFLDTFRLPLEQLFAGYGVEKDDLSKAEEEWNAAVSADRTVLPMSGVHGMLDELKGLGIEVGVVSAADSEVIENDIAALGLEGRFAFVADSAAPKRLALARLVARCVGRVAYLGDTEHDVSEARAAGALPIGFGAGYRPPEALLAAGAECVVMSLRNVPTLLSQVCS